MSPPTPDTAAPDAPSGPSTAAGCGIALTVLVAVLFFALALQRCASSDSASPPAEVRTEETTFPPTTIAPATSASTSLPTTGSSAPPATVSPPVLPPSADEPDLPDVPPAEPSTFPPTTLVISHTYIGNGDAVVSVERPIVAGTVFYCTYTGGRQFNLRVGTEVLVSAPVGDWTGVVTYQGAGSYSAMEVRAYGDWEVMVVWYPAA